MIRTARSDEASSVRQGAIAYFITSTGDDTLLNQLPASQKKALLPAFVGAMQDAQLRHNAAILLRFYPEEREVVAPVLLQALQDRQPYVRLYAAQALNRLGPDLGKTAGATSILVAFAKDPDDQLASKAVVALAASGSEAELAVPAPMECLQGTNSLIGCEAVWALEWAPREFDAYAERIIPALRSA
jgi:HEAT repeat protein